ncbi:MAG: type II secretion system F family protein, partial [Pseudomonadota bacterium]
ANIAFTPTQIMLMMAVLSGVSFMLLTVLTSVSPTVRILVAVLMGVGSVYVWIASKAKKRMNMINEQLPEAVELMVRSLRVGHPFSNAINIVANEVPDPLGTEMGMIADEAAYGRDMGETLKAMAERLDNQDMRFLAVAVTIQQTSGGNLAEILDGLAKVIRARFRLFRRVAAITAEAKWSGNLLSAFPIVALLGINLVRPDYYDDVMESPLFIPACLVVAGFLVANLLVMRALVNIKV